MAEIQYSGDIAIVGLSGAFPGARNPDEFWEALSSGREMIRFVPPRNDGNGMEPRTDDPRFIRAVAAMDDVDLFDASFFGMTPAEAELTDPQHRLLLEHSWRAFEDAGYDAQHYPGTAGVFAGATINTYLLRNIASHKSLLEEADPIQLNIGNSGDFLTTRISYKLGLKGPSHTVQCACSTSLVAVHCACRSLLDLECDVALAGGVSVNVNLMEGYRYREGGIFSPDGHCRVFDVDARGTVFGSGVAMVLLKRLEDALRDGDLIHATIKGSAINNDGSLKAGYTTPSVEGQAEVISEALGNAGVGAETISYVECHGTGTLLGDPVEIRALTKAFQAETGKQGFCAVGSVKSNVGHLDAAAGITGLIKVVQSLKHQVVPPSLYCKQLNPQIDFAHSPFYVNTERSPWKQQTGPRRAGVSAFGVGGTNAHVIVEEAPSRQPLAPGRDWHLLVLSARTPAALKRTMQNLETHLRKHEEVDLADASFTLQVGRRPFAYRWAGAFQQRAEALRILETGVEEDALEDVQEASRKTAFLFPGQGSQYPGMGRQLYEKEGVFRESMQQCQEILRPHLKAELCTVVYERGGAEIDQTSLAQPALFAVEYSLTRLWRSWGIKPQAMLGHSIGEYTAACVAGVLSLEDALRVVAQRGKLMQEMAAGGMLAVEMGEVQLRNRLRAGLSIAAINATDLCVVSGALHEIEEMERELQRGGMNCKRLRTSHAFHSAMVEPAMGAFLETMKQVRLNAPRIPFLSNVTGTWIQDQQARDPRYWVRHLREPVQFEQGLKELADARKWMLVEVGPGQSLKRLAQKRGTGNVVVPSLSTGSSPGSETSTMLRGLGVLWSGGSNVDWQGFHAGHPRHRVPLPTYSFERKRYWIGPCEATIEGASPMQEPVLADEPKPMPPLSRPPLRNSYVPPKNAAESTVVSILERALGIRPVGVTDIYGQLGGDSLTAIKIIDQVNSTFHCTLKALDLYEGLAVRDLVQLIDNHSPAKDHSDSSEEETGKGDRRHRYRAKRRELHHAETVP